MTPAKQIVVEELGHTNVSVTRGRGTAHNWITIKYNDELTKADRDRIEIRLLNAGLVGSYGDDYGGNNVYICVSWRHDNILERLRMGRV